LTYTPAGNPRAFLVDGRQHSSDHRTYPARLSLGQALVAVPCTNSDLVTALGTSTAKDSSASLGLHPRKKPMGLCAVAAIGLKGTLRHVNRLLLSLLLFATVSQYT